ncbi:uncharacterized protein LOC130985736 isoform X2 [Salvia miltiorrhiza]|uniref:uncharacterized protein LOC130985736 isoform X2 n=1 Tax=Salvia miltiorrhiza TaxID=226208 RepID=UPI0025AD2AA6|nr:uncharacterized protein LOC130985736 isoform X2 [Salvia miltiorrhiza]XP_057764823.1 uncharacterized protein LOC130985736 isoform X2 [Salvia miltiorrhiza]XP_057764824.1 uncharacterized protein LOC130985736 isoform X2 [Salvia miltiorrhiza]
MTEIPKLEDMGSDHLVTNCLAGEFGENQKISVVDHVNALHHSCTKSDSFVVDMERFSHLIEKDTTSANSRITRNLSRKGSMRTAERKGSSNERDVSMLATSPRADFTPEKQAVVAAGPHDHSIPPQVHHQITITNGSITSTAVADAKRFTFRRSSPTWTIDPRRILFFFATLSCIGTILLIYFTLSMGKFNGDGDSDTNALN